MEGGPRPPARVGGNYGQTERRLSPWKGGFPASSRTGEVTMARLRGGRRTRYGYLTRAGEAGKPPFHGKTLRRS